jgi:hypothetical protein
MLQGCYRTITVVDVLIVKELHTHRCYRCVVGVLQRSYSDGTRVLKRCYRGVTRILQGCHKGGTVIDVLLVKEFWPSIPSHNHRHANTA